jgi:hypothetical protein
MLEKTKTVSWMLIIALVLLVVLVVIQLTTKQTILNKDGSVSTVSSTNLLKKS